MIVSDGFLQASSWELVEPVNHPTTTMITGGTSDQDDMTWVGITASATALDAAIATVDAWGGDNMAFYDVVTRVRIHFEHLDGSTDVTSEPSIGLTSSLGFVPIGSFGVISLPIGEGGIPPVELECSLRQLYLDFGLDEETIDALFPSVGQAIGEAYPDGLTFVLSTPTTGKMVARLMEFSMEVFVETDEPEIEHVLESTRRAFT